MRALAHAPVPALRVAFAALKRLALFTAYAAVDDAGRNALWSRIGYPGPRTDRPQTPLSVPSVTGATGRVRADAVVIGSGAGGGVAAALLAASGRATIVLDAGPAFEQIAHAQLEAAATAELYLDGGTASSTDLGVAILAGACVGGGTTVNWMTSLRMTSSAIAQWETASGLPSLGGDLEIAYRAVEQRLGVCTTTAHNRNNAVIADGCAKLGWRTTLIPRNAAHCGEGCGYCGFGCAYGNKRGTAMTYLRDAVRDGARIYASTAAVRVRIDRGRVAGVDAAGMQIDAPLVIVAAGSLRTPALLARSGISSPHLGRHLRLHPVRAFSAEFETPVEPWHGPIQTIACTQFDDLDEGYGAVIEACPAHPGIIASSLAWRSRSAHAQEMLRARNSATLIVLARDRGEGEVSIDGRNDVRYRVGRDDARRLREMLLRGREMAFAAGAKRVAPIEEMFFSAHQMGTARMSADPRNGVVDTSGRVHGVEGLIVGDASVFPLASGVNPMLTIMALAYRAIKQIS